MSKFLSAMNAVKNRTNLHPPEALADPIRADPTLSSAPEAAPPPVRRGRPLGKRSSAAMTQVTAYITTTTHMETKIRLLQNAQKQKRKQDFSGLVEELLLDWLTKQV